MNNTFKLGRSIAEIVPFRIIQRKPEEIFTNKVLIIMGTVAIVKVAVFYSLVNIEYFL
jgi:hypothetical protein